MLIKHYRSCDRLSLRRWFFPKLLLIYNNMHFKGRCVGSRWLDYTILQEEETRQPRWQRWLRTIDLWTCKFRMGFFFLFICLFTFTKICRSIGVVGESTKSLCSCSVTFQFLDSIKKLCLLLFDLIAISYVWEWFFSCSSMDSRYD